MTRTTELRVRLLALALLAIVAAAQPAPARPVTAAPGPARVAARDAADLADFERRAEMSRELGATQMVVTEGLPLGTWEFDKDDPYPAWFLHHATLLKIFPATDVAPFVDGDYVAHVQAILGKRCAVLRRYGLKGVWIGNEPAVLPEAFFAAHPELRGPRIDHPARSRKVHYAPNVDRPEMLRMYRDSMQAALRLCPELETFSWVTTDAGSGFDWVPALYSGLNGSAEFRDRPIADRVAGFLINLQQAAKAEGHDIRINVNQIEPRQWMIPTFGPDVLENIVRKLPRGLAVQGLEGPDGRAFATGGGERAGNAFYPVVGLFAPGLAGVPTSASDRVTVNLGDAASLDLNYRMLKATLGRPQQSMVQRLAALRAFAVAEVGEDQADNLIEIWSALGDARRNLAVLDFGGVLRFGHVLNRWVTRPMVPYPLELTDAEKRDYRPFLFQAKGEAEAADLVDIQAMRMYEGWGAKLLFQRTIELTQPRLAHALALLRGLEAAARDESRRHQWNLMGKRVQALIYLLRSADNMVAYQAQLDRVTAVGAKPEENPVLGTQSSWDRTDLMATARSEIDTMVALAGLIESTPEPILDLAPTVDEESIMRLGPDLARQIHHKIATMNAHWRDYDRMFTVPNP